MQISCITWQLLPSSHRIRLAVGGHYGQEQNVDLGFRVLDSIGLLGLAASSLLLPAPGWP